MWAVPDQEMNPTRIVPPPRLKTSLLKCWHHYSTLCVTVWGRKQHVLNFQASEDLEVLVLLRGWLNDCILPGSSAKF